MSKIIKKSDITNLVEATMKEAGILGESEDLDMMTSEAEEIEVTVSDDETEITHGDKEVEIEDKETVEESVNRLAEQASKHNIISENLKKDLESFNKIVNYKY